MNQQSVLTVVLAVVGGVGGGFLGARLGGPPAPPVAAPALGVAPEPQHAAEIAALVQRNTSIERSLEEIRLALADVSAAQRTAIAARASEPASAPIASATSSAAKADAKPDAGTAMDRLLAGGLEWEEAQALWKEVAAAGKLDELVQILEQRAKARGNDPDAQTQLGLAYLQKTFRAGGGPEAGIWATKADRAFDAALAADDKHWEARFQKAVSLSFWPPMLGKQPDAVKQFETLVAQQEASGSKQKGYAATYLFLGNMHLQMGAKDKALAAWNQGLAQFPDDAELLKKIADVH
ncbi:MAG: tetratricopeptide repeat protein [Planctomycetota bacterium]|nr:tetratricopeptide repeat protein [Planctomycetota bacterium]